MLLACQPLGIGSAQAPCWTNNTAAETPRTIRRIDSLAENFIRASFECQLGSLERASLRFRSRLLDDLCPLDRFRPDVGGELRRRAADGLSALAREALDDLGQMQDRDDLAVEPRDDRDGRACGHHHSVPS